MDTTTDPNSMGAGDAILLVQKLDTGAAPQLHAKLTSCLGKDVTLDGTEVTQLGGRCLDLLLSAKHHWTEAGHTFAIHDPSDALLRDLATFGVPSETFAAGGAP